MRPSCAGTYSCTSAVLSIPSVIAFASAACCSASGVSKRTMPAPLPPMLALTTTGNRSPCAAPGACRP
jgi:hypothetical protein